MPVIPFTKASACGNDFLIIPIEHASNDIAGLTRRICERHNGVGADGVEWLIPSATATVEARLINADGSEAEVSGNGTRCVAAYLVDAGAGSTVTVLTGAGVKTCDLISRDGYTFEFKAAMGEPRFTGEVPIHTTYGESRGLVVSTGNPHYVVFVSEFEPNWQSLADAIQRDPYFKQGTNVEFVKILDCGHIDVRLYERGVGETQSSGTGSCAAAVASIHTGRCESPLMVTTAGGTQKVEWQGGIFLYGPATIVCRGEFFV